MQEKWHSWFDYTWGIWICATWIACGWFRERRYDFSPEAVAADRWLLLGILFASLLPVLWYSLRFFTWTPVQRYPRLTWSRLVHALLGDSFVTCVLLATYGRVWTLAEIGFRTEPPWNWTILFGLLCYRFSYLAHAALARWTEPPAQADLQYLRQSRVHYFLPRGRTAQVLSGLLIALLGPIHEEIVYRGFLVYMLGNLTGQTVLAILFGLVLCLWVHLYQGWRAMLGHFLFYASAITILYSPAGLLAVLVMHIANNLHHVLTLPGSIQQLLAWLREERKKQQTSNPVTAAKSQD